MDLADQIVERNTTLPDPATDEFGMVPPVPQTPEYLVARALAINELTLEQMHAPRIRGLHLRGDEVWQNQRPLKQQTEEVYQLTRIRRNLHTWEIWEFWQVLKQYLPQLRKQYFQIAEGLFWDVNCGNIVKVTDWEKEYDKHSR